VSLAGGAALSNPVSLKKDWQPSQEFSVFLLLQMRVKPACSNKNTLRRL